MHFDAIIRSMNSTRMCFPSFSIGFIHFQSVFSNLSNLFLSLTLYRLFKFSNELA
jgi:hypothetical protein